MAEQRNIHTAGIILKKHPIGESDFLVTLYSPDAGKIQAVAKGARKITSSFGGHLETLNICEFQLYKSPARYTIVQCQSKENFKNIREDFERAMIAGLILEIFHKSTISSEHSPVLFNLLQESLQKLSNSEQHFLTVEGFKINLLHHIGILPNLENCSFCLRRWDSEKEKAIWLQQNGHLHCNECITHQNHTGTEQHRNQPAKKIELGIIKLIKYLNQPIKNQTHKISYSADQKNQLQHITNFFLQHFLDREIVSEKILQQI